MTKNGTRNKSRRTNLSLDKSTGRFTAKLGRTQTRSGKFDGHRFRFSEDERESERRKQRIQELWDRVVDAWDRPGKPIWDDIALQVAKALERGETQVPVPYGMIAPELDSGPKVGIVAPLHYVHSLNSLQERFPQVQFVPEDEQIFARGVSQAQSSMAELTRLTQPNNKGPANPGDPDEPTVGDALEQFERKFIRERMLIDPDPEEGIEGKRLSDTANSWIKCLERIREHNAEQLKWQLSRLTFDGCEAVLAVWRQRLPKKDGSGPMAIKTCREHAKLLTRFFRWLSKSDKFDWKKPDDFDELNVSIHKSNRDRAALVTSPSRQVETFTVEVICKGEGEGRQISVSPESLLFLNDNGHSYTKPTKSGNSNNQITNMWSRLTGQRHFRFVIVTDGRLLGHRI